MPNGGMGGIPIPPIGGGGAAKTPPKPGIGGAGKANGSSCAYIFCNQPVNIISKVFVGHQQIEKNVNVATRRVYVCVNC